MKGLVNWLCNCNVIKKPNSVAPLQLRVFPLTAEASSLPTRRAAAASDSLHLGRGREALDDEMFPDMGVRLRLGKSTGNHRNAPHPGFVTFSPQNERFPVAFPLNHFWETDVKKPLGHTNIATLHHIAGLPVASSVSN